MRLFPGERRDQPPCQRMRKAAIKRIEGEYGALARKVDHTDGVSIEFDDWRFNLRTSNTEPLVRLNVESRGDEALMREKTEELLKHLES